MCFSIIRWSYFSGDISQFLIADWEGKNHKILKWQVDHYTNNSAVEINTLDPAKRC